MPLIFSNTSPGPKEETRKMTLAIKQLFPYKSCCLSNSQRLIPITQIRQKIIFITMNTSPIHGKYFKMTQKFIIMSNTKAKVWDEALCYNGKSNSLA
jgi:hypothetical protein